MEADGSACPEDHNSTDCLLRSLLQLMNADRNPDDTKTDWDPITFGFTAVIGVIAIVFALIPIFQTFVTATGKGRRKTNNRAIGKWSQQTSKQWSRSEMSYEFTARTPILRSSTILPWILQTLEENMKEAGENLTKPATRQSARRDGFGASWLGFFEHTGLDINIPAESDNLRAVAVEYLPDDLVAAPAYAEVGVIVTLAAAAGLQSLTMDKTTGYPSLLGHGFQFDFRQHPVLGIIGAYSRYGPGPRNSAIPTLQQLATMVPYMYEFIDIDDRTGCSIAALDVFNKFAGEGMEKQLQFAGSHDIRHHDYFIPLRPFWTYQEDYIPIATLFLARTPKHPTLFFPISKLKSNNPLTILALNGTYWPTADFSLTTHRGHGRLHSEQPRWASWVEIGIDTVGYMPPDWLENHTRTLKEGKESLDRKAVRGHVEVFEMSLRLLHDVEDVYGRRERSRGESRKLLRSKILEDIEEVDRWLHMTETRARLVSYRTTVLCNTFCLLSNVRTQVNDNASAGKHLNEPVPSTGGRQPVEASVTQQPDHSTAETRHHDVLVALRKLLGQFSFSKELTKAISKLHIEDISSKYEPLASFVKAVKENSSDLHRLTGIYMPEQSSRSIAMTHRMLLRLRAVANRSDMTYNWLYLHNSVDSEIDDAKDLDDVIIYRCLLICLLFRTALDPTELVQSGLWKQVVPII